MRHHFQRSEILDQQLPVSRTPRARADDRSRSPILPRGQQARSPHQQLSPVSWPAGVGAPIHHQRCSLLFIFLTCCDFDKASAAARLPRIPDYDGNATGQHAHAPRLDTRAASARRRRTGRRRRRRSTFQPRCTRNIAEHFAASGIVLLGRASPRRAPAARAATIRELAAISRAAQGRADMPSRSGADIGHCARFSRFGRVRRRHASHFAPLSRAGHAAMSPSIPTGA